MPGSHETIAKFTLEGTPCEVALTNEDAPHLVLTTPARTPSGVVIMRRSGILTPEQIEFAREELADFKPEAFTDLLSFIDDADFVPRIHSIAELLAIKARG